MLAYKTNLSVASEHGVLFSFLCTSITRDTDSYNERGINVSAAERRQALIPWTTVKYSKDIIKDGKDDE